MCWFRGFGADGVGYGGDGIAIRDAILRFKSQSMGAKPYGHVVELHPVDTEHNRVVTELGYKHGYLFSVFMDR